MPLSQGAYSAGCEPTITQCASPRAPPALRQMKIRHFSRPTGPVYASPLPRAPRQTWTRVFYRGVFPRFPLHTVFAHGFPCRLLTASRLGFTPHTGVSTRVLRPPLGLGWSFCSTVALRRRLNAAVLLFSGCHPYSPAYPHPLRSALGFHRRGGMALAGSCLAV